MIQDSTAKNSDVGPLYRGLSGSLQITADILKIVPAWAWGKGGGAGIGPNDKLPVLIRDLEVLLRKIHEELIQLQIPHVPPPGPGGD